MAEFSGGKALVYHSDRMVERRRRILREVRKLISEAGFEGFSVRELCARAGIAQKTLYNAFGNKDNVIAVAIRQYMTDFDDQTSLRFDPATLEGRLERSIKVYARGIQLRSYTTAIMAVYTSPTAEKAVRDAIRGISVISLKSFVEALDAGGALAPGVSAERFAQLVTTGTYAVLSDWRLGDLPDDQLIDRVSEVFLLHVAGCTVGRAHEEAQRWLDDLRGAGPGWLELRRMAEAPPAERRGLSRRANTPPKPAKTARPPRRKASNGES